ncbi:metallophosphoesterase [Piscinibacter sp.]|uniref:metallophosphoesterase n=1 Tax=Piscinibacter sp. TaxID=1903157 RepID=UPI002D09AB48|nr:metallophosphoesterase [Albitalea sp.]HUG25521.1 metallophosphoesterase [Albitalea sp.]
MPLLLLSTLLHAYIGWRLLPAWAGQPAWQGLLAGVLAASALLMPLSLAARRWRSPRGAAVLTWAGLLFLGLFSSLFVLTLLRDAVWLVVAGVALLWSGADAGVFGVWSGRAVPVAAGVVTLWGFLNARRTAAVVSVDVPIRGLPPALHGFTIAQISDLHIGPTIKHDYLDAVVRAVNRLGADMVAVTGDLVDGRVHELAPHVAPLSALASRHGTYFVTGNHEYYSGAAAWVVELRRLGVRVLQNEHVVLRHGSAALLVAGVNDYGAHHFDPAQRSDPQAALAGAPPDTSVRVLLAHQPRSAEAAERAGYHLQLSGHTHGGQFWPWNLFVPLQQPFTAGLHRLGGLWVYTSRGTGYWGPPKRFGAPSEITRLRLIAAA